MPVRPATFTVGAGSCRARGTPRKVYLKIDPASRPHQYNPNPSESLHVIYLRVDQEGGKFINRQLFIYDLFTGRKGTKTENV